MSKPVFLPNSQSSGNAIAWQWLKNIPIELALIALTEQEKKHLAEYYQEAGLLTAWRRPFFKRHYAQTLATSIDHLHPLLNNHIAPKLLDLGCGSGTQSILFACLGFHVVAVDGDAEALEVLKKRKQFYEQQLGRALPIDIIYANTLTLDYQSIGPFQAMHSLFAFNMMQPSLTLFEKILPELAQGARLIIHDGNCQSLINRIFRPRQVLSPIEMAQYLEQHHFQVLHHQGGITLPPFCWTMNFKAWLNPVDSWCNQHWWLPISHHLIAKRK